ncbi:hypothetical protein [Mucilaginibacter sp. SG564]|uniref:hypothetical protein n=1 Tax=Mucilaginibacter sp. SG564 TaxID=2587022 RepID=UPI00155480DC|nr:hypothetical protein [Mucilaginibacter sp. SG564]NOW96053.1 hypothetical protein [Mucilaginibacter sp. SG564]
MKTKILKHISAACLFLGASIFLFSCGLPIGNTSNTKGGRKKMLYSDGGGIGWDAYNSTGSTAANQSVDQTPYPALPFQIADTVINFGTNKASFYVVRVPSDNFDFLLPLAKIYEPYLVSSMSTWAQTGRSGIAIDFSSGSISRRSLYSLNNSSLHVSIPLVILYDDASQARANNLTKLIQSLNTIRITELQ